MRGFGRRQRNLGCEDPVPAPAGTVTPPLPPQVLRTDVMSHARTVQSVTEAGQGLLLSSLGDSVEGLQRSLQQLGQHWDLVRSETESRQLELENNLSQVRPRARGATGEERPALSPASPAGAGHHAGDHGAAAVAGAGGAAALLLQAGLGPPGCHQREAQRTPGESQHQPGHCCRTRPRGLVISCGDVWPRAALLHTAGPGSFCAASSPQPGRAWYPSLSPPAL